MKLKGTLTSGSGEGAYYMSQEAYITQFREKLGFKPYPGTLNIIIDKSNVAAIKKCFKKAGLVKGWDNFGDVLYIRAVLNEKIEGAVVFPVKTHHPREVLEFIAPLNLRQTLKLKDGDTVILYIREC